MIRRSRPLAGLLLALAVTLLLPAAPAVAADDASIAHVESTAEGLRVLVTVPPTAQVDLAGVAASLDSQPLDATATLAESDTVVKRTTVLAIDTSDSMARQGRFEAAQAAANEFLDTVPADVEVGIVTFDGEVTTALEPTTDRGAARAVVSGLELAAGTLLYDGVRAAVDLAGADGQRSVLVLSDGADTGGAASLDDVTSEVVDTSTLVDVVSLGQEGSALEALREMSEAGNGRVVEASGDALAEAFAAEAELLASQVLVTAPLPGGFDATQATVEVTLATDSGELVASAFTRIQDASPTRAPIAAPEPAETGWEAPEWLLYAGATVFGVGILLVVALLIPRRPAPASITERLGAYTSHTGAGAGMPGGRTDAEPVLDQAKAAAEGILKRNRGLDRRLSALLAAAGSQLKPSEWLLVHLGIVFGAALLGLLLGGGGIVLTILFLALGLVVPVVYLRFQAGRRRRAFNANLPETLSLLSGGLSAGLSLAQSVDTVVREGPEPIASEFKRVLVETRIGVDLEDAFDGVAERFNSRDFAWVVMAIRIQRQVGGNLAELLTTVAGTMREREYLRRQVQTLAAEGKLSAFILSALPPVFAVYLLLTQPGFMDPMTGDPLGLAILIGATFWLGLGIFWMSRLVKVEV